MSVSLLRSALFLSLLVVGGWSLKCCQYAKEDAPAKEKPSGCTPVTCEAKPKIWGTSCIVAYWPIKDNDPEPYYYGGCIKFGKCV